MEVGILEAFQNYDGARDDARRRPTAAPGIFTSDLVCSGATVVH